MTGAAWGFLYLTASIAAVNWFAVSTERRSLEYFCKPATMVALLGVCLTLDPIDGASRTAFVVALLFCLAGDVFLMLPKDMFVAGLAAFLVGHLAYVAGVLALHESWPLAAVGVAVVVVAMTMIAPKILRSVREKDPKLLGPVIAYMAVISLMVVSAWGTGIVLMMVGALLFYASDAILAWCRFVKEHDFGRLAVMVTYHLGQICLVLGLVG